MMEDPVAATRIREYLANHHQNYTFGALRERLIRAGEDPHLVDTIIAEMRAKTARIDPFVRNVWIAGVGFGIANVCILPLLFVFTINYRFSEYWFVPLICVIGFEMLIGSVLIRRSLLDRHKLDRRVIMQALSAWLIPLGVAFLLLFGVCIIPSFVSSHP